MSEVPSVKPRSGWPPHSTPPTSMRASPSAVTSDAPGGEVKCRLLRRASMMRRSWSDFLETKKIPTSSRRSL
eukprot:8853572-Pyramimonas_sp.AAC.1